MHRRDACAVGLVSGRHAPSSNSGMYNGTINDEGNIMSATNEPMTSAHEALNKVAAQAKRGLITTAEADAQFLRILVDFKIAVASN